MTLTNDGCHRPGRQAGTASPPDPLVELRLNDLADWAMGYAGAVASLIDTPTSSDLFLLSQAAKLTEEVGELHAAILGRLKHQRPDKIIHEATISSEVADVIICTAVISQVLKIDVVDAVRSKIHTLEERVKSFSTAESEDNL